LKCTSAKASLLNLEKSTQLAFKVFKFTRRWGITPSLMISRLESICTTSRYTEKSASEVELAILIRTALPLHATDGAMQSRKTHQIIRLQELEHIHIYKKAYVHADNHNYDVLAQVIAGY